jgi:hypothetical protein
MPLDGDGGEVNGEGAKGHAEQEQLAAVVRVGIDIYVARHATGGTIDPQIDIRKGVGHQHSTGVTHLELVIGNVRSLSTGAYRRPHCRVR